LPIGLRQLTARVRVGQIMFDRAKAFRECGIDDAQFVETFFLFARKRPEQVLDERRVAGKSVRRHLIHNETETWDPCHWSFGKEARHVRSRSRSLDARNMRAFGLSAYFNARSRRRAIRNAPSPE